MATSYTHNIKDGITFKTYALQCATAFGALISMIDASFSTPIPGTIEVSDYHLSELKDAEKRLEEFDKLDRLELEKIMKNDYQTAKSDSERRVKEKENLFSRYDSMLKEVNAWIPPTKEHHQLKRFMKEQIIDSMRYDCDFTYDTIPEEKDIGDWIKIKRDELLYDTDYHKKEYEEEVHRVSEKNEWLQKLRDSLK